MIKYFSSKKPTHLTINHIQICPTEVIIARYNILKDMAESEPQITYFVGIIPIKTNTKCSRGFIQKVEETYAFYMHVRRQRTCCEGLVIHQHPINVRIPAAQFLKIVPSTQASFQKTVPASRLGAAQAPHQLWRQMGSPFDPSTRIRVDRYDHSHRLESSGTPMIDRNSFRQTRIVPTRQRSET